MVLLINSSWSIKANINFKNMASNYLSIYQNKIDKDSKKKVNISISNIMGRVTGYLVDQERSLAYHHHLQKY